MWRVRPSSWNAKRPDVYHTDRDCKLLNRADDDRIDETDNEEIERLGLRQCRQCKGVVTNTMQCPLCGAEITDFRRHVDTCTEVNM